MTMPFDPMAIPMADPGPALPPPEGDAMPLEPAPMLAPPMPPVVGNLTEDELVAICRETKEEARSGRQGGDQPRDVVWKDNVDLYWGRQDTVGKADWQHKEVMRDATNMVKRLAASLKRALMQPGEWWDIADLTHGDKAVDLHPFVRRLVDSQLLACGTTTSGDPAPFPLVFSAGAKMAGQMAFAAIVSYDAARNRVRVDLVDPRQLFYDPTGRGMYRLRNYEMDRHRLLEAAKQVDANGVPFYYLDRVETLGDQRRADEENERRDMTSHGEGARPSGRKSVELDEFLFHELVDRQGNLVAKNVVVVMANEQRIIRGPEPNPHWHGRDWIVYAPMFDEPLAPYGSTYMEGFAADCRTYNALTQMLVDSTFTSAMRMFAMKPDFLDDPDQINGGAHPLKMWFLNEDAPSARDFMESVDLGNFPREAIEVWSGVKGQMREHSNQNQIELGQLPSKEATATEIESVGQAGSELVMDVAEGIDAGWLSPILERVFFCAVQHLDFNDPRLVRTLGPEVASMFNAQRQGFQEPRFGFKAKAISGIAERNMLANKILRALQVIAPNQVLATEFLATHDMKAVLGALWRGLGINAPEFQRQAGATPPADSPQVQAAKINAEASARAAAQQQQAPNGGEE